MLNFRKRNLAKAKEGILTNCLVSKRRTQSRLKQELEVQPVVEAAAMFVDQVGNARMQEIAAEQVVAAGEEVA